MKTEIEERLERQKKVAEAWGFNQMFTEKSVELDSMQQHKEEKKGITNVLVLEWNFPYDFYVVKPVLYRKETIDITNGDGSFLGDELLKMELTQEEYENKSEDFKTYFNHQSFYYALENLSYQDLINVCKLLFEEDRITGARILKTTKDSKCYWTIEALIKSKYSPKSVVASREVSIRPQSKQYCKVNKTKH